jgi:shikimate dehydrogenase
MFATMTTDYYAVIGNPIAHSLSPLIHAAFADQCDQQLTYTRILASLDGFAEAVAEFQAKGGKGLNVTLPFKEQARQLCVSCTERARSAGAVNTLTFNADAGICGDITDGVGLVRDLCANHGLRLQGQRIAILGAGGAVRGVLADLLAEAPSTILIVNRTVDRALAIAATFNSPVVQAGPYTDLAGQRFDMIINATSASLQDLLPPLPEGILDADAYCYDMVYARNATPFMRWGTAQGARVCSDGLGMLVEQAAEAFFIWRGVRPATAPVIKWLRSLSAASI